MSIPNTDINQVMDDLLEHNFHSSNLLGKNDDMQQVIIDISLNIGEVLKQESFGITRLQQEGYQKELGVHLDGVYLQDNTIEYLSLFGNSNHNHQGGETIIYDTSRAIEEIGNDFPDIESLKFIYKSSIYGIENTKYFIELINGSQCLNYIYNGLFTNEESNEFLEKLGLTLKQFHNKIQTIVSKYEVLRKKIKKGDIILIKNLKTLHNRTALNYGERDLYRVRYNDPNNQVHIVLS